MLLYGAYLLRVYIRGNKGGRQLWLLHMTPPFRTLVHFVVSNVEQRWFRGLPVYMSRRVYPLIWKLSALRAIQKHCSLCAGGRQLAVQ
jgi:hypothetical protein